ncbi:hypothetical protein M3Y99_00698800 [Aphelenchoides fujianensis]|nr:hypothetical protein M3Y99_00698800 [Aphelenchoides fujianensis]
MTVGFTVQSAFLIKQYLRYGRTTNLKINYQGQLAFPAVTVCSVNPFKRSELNASEALSNLVNAYEYTVQQKRRGNTIVLNRKKRQSGSCSSGQTITNRNNGTLVYEYFPCGSSYILTLYCSNSKFYPRNITMSCAYNDQKVAKFQNQAACWQSWCGSQGTSACAPACDFALYQYGCVSQRDEFLDAAHGDLHDHEHAARLHHHRLFLFVVDFDEHKHPPNDDNH